MEIYYKNHQGQLEQTSLKDILKHALVESNFKMDNGSFEGENHHWVGIVQKSKKPSKVVVNITFDDNDNLTEVKVFETPIKMVEDDDNSKQII